MNSNCNGILHKPNNLVQQPSHPHIINGYHPTNGFIQQPASYIFQPLHNPIQNFQQLQYPSQGLKNGGRMTLSKPRLTIGQICHNTSDFPNSIHSDHFVQIVTMVRHLENITEIYSQ